DQAGRIRLKKRILEMRKAIIVLALMPMLQGCSSSSRATSDALTGRWEGSAEIAGAKTRAVVDFTADANGALHATISVPDERLLGKPLINVRYEAPQVHFELQATERRIIFDGSRSGEVISGSVRGGDIS